MARTVQACQLALWCEFLEAQWRMSWDVSDSERVNVPKDVSNVPVTPASEMLPP